MAIRRRWCTLSLRTMLLGITLLSVLFAWQFYYRARKMREARQMQALLAERGSYVNLRFTVLGWKVPSESVWLQQLGFPEPDTIRLLAKKDSPLPAEFCEIARRCSKVEYEGEGASDAELANCLSASTTDLRIVRNGVSGDCLSSAGDSPQLRRVEVGYVTLKTRSLAALLNHPRIEQLDIDAAAEDLSLIPELERPNALRSLDLHLEYTWQGLTLSIPSSGPWTPPSPADFPGPTGFRRPSGDFAWLKQCPELREIFLSMLHEPYFVEAVGRHLSGVERLNIHDFPLEVLGSLNTWTRLRHLCIDGGDIDDQKLTRIVELCSGLQTLEIDEYSQPSATPSPQGLRSLQKLKGLKRLHLGGCRLSVEHMQVIAELTQLEEISLEDPGVVDQTVEPLTTLPNLKRISLERTKASDKVFAGIRGDWDERRPWRN